MSTELLTTNLVQKEAERPRSPSRGGQKRKAVECSTSQDLRVEAGSGDTKRGCSSAIDDKQDEDNTKRGFSSAKDDIQDEDNPYAYACHMVDSPPSSQGT